MFHLGWFAFEGVQGWTSPDYQPDYDWSRPDQHQAMAKQLEKACFDYLLIEDTSAISDDYAGSMEIYLRNALGSPKFDPAPLATYIAAVTTHLGVVPTLTTSFYPPYLLARLAASMAHLSGGRFGWNIVTSSSNLAARNYGMEGLPEHDERYDIADEYLELCERLWQSWERDAVVANPASGVFADHRKVHRLDFRGAHFACRGPLNVPRPPNDRPVLAQAGNSPRGMRFAARHADIVLTPVNHPPAVKKFRDEIRRLATEAGRNPDDVKVMALAFPRIFLTRDDVNAYRESLNHVPDDIVRHWLALVSSITTLDLSRFDLDEPLPDHVQTNGSRGTLDWLRQGNATLRQIGLRMARLTPGEPMVGTAEQVAEEMGRAMDVIGGDGFLISGSLTPRHVSQVVDELIPALQCRGLVRQHYAHRTLREHLLEF
jgi:FMN-dependent oxidoreductase (nitrilotriacetate monooxygenase family)